MSASATAGFLEAIADFMGVDWSRCQAPIEVDYSFFFDPAGQINVTRIIVNVVDVLVEAAKQKIGQPLRWQSL
jgi:hypothetical protein